MKNAKPNVLFFSRDYQSLLFPRLKINGYNFYHVTLTKQEKKNVLKAGGKVVGCLEEDFYKLDETNIMYPYLKFSWRSDRYLRKHSYSERISIQKKIVSFWSKILERYNPISVINEPVSIEIAEVLFLECEKRNIKYLTLSTYLMQDTVFFAKKAYHSSYGNSLNDIRPNKDSIEKAKRLILNIQDNIFKPSYVKNLESRHSIIRLTRILVSLFLEFIKIVKLKDRLIYQLCYGNNVILYKFNLSLYAKSLFFSKKYDQLKEVKKNVEMVYFPIHFEPEAVILYTSYFYSDQECVIINILKCLNENQVLVVKEHPNQPGALLQRKFQKIKDYSANILFLPAETPSNIIIQSCKFVITLGSSVGFEALAIGKPVINFGKVYYDSYEGIYNVYSFDELYTLIRENNFNKVDKDIINFTARIISKMKAGNPFPHENLYSKDNIKKVSLSFEEELNKMRTSS
jgi:hypothetical protein